MYRHPQSRDRQSSFSSAGSHYSAASSAWSHGSDRTASTAMSDRSVPQYPAAGRAGLPCEFFGYGGCDQVFTDDDVDNWIEHIITEHLDGKLPKKAICWFCDDIIFDYKRTGDRRTNFDDRMWHIRDHFLYDGKTVHDMRPDHHLNTHLIKHELIPHQTYNSVRRYSEVPQPNTLVAHGTDRSDFQRKDPRRDLEYSNPHDEERSYRRHTHKSGKNRK